jgi:hypothetical protein
VFHDRAELSASSDLNASITDALRASRYLIVICSPDAARSKWVDMEVRAFYQMHGRGRAFAFVVSGDPTGVTGDSCLPPMLRGAEPLAADARPAADGKTDAKLKLLAAMLGVGFDALKQRDVQRRIRRLRVGLALALSLVICFAGMALYAYHEKGIAQQRLIESTKRLATQYVQRGWQTFDEGDEAESLLWHVEAFRVLKEIPGALTPPAERAYRIRIARVRAHCPRLCDALVLSSEPVESIALSPNDKAFMIITRCPKVGDARDAPSTDAISIREYSITDGSPLGKKIEAERNPEDPLNDWLDQVRYNSNGSVIVTRSGHAWSAITGEPIPGAGEVLAQQTFPEISDRERNFLDDFHVEHEGAIISPDGRWLISRGGNTGNDTIDFTDLASGRIIRRIDTKDGGNPETYFCVSEDARLLLSSFAVGHLFATAKVWDVTAGRVLFEIRHPNSLRCAAFTPDGSILATGGEDGTVRLWSTKSGKELSSALRHGNSVEEIRFSADGSRVISVDGELP